jgi:dipeptidyl aminopeptidase/acylaminoacyl peptidase
VIHCELKTRPTTMHTTVAPYGTWSSPITAQRVAAGTRPLSSPFADRGAVYWLESLPAEGGRVAALRRTPGGGREVLTPAPCNVRTRVHEYGGGAWLVADGVVWFSNFEDHLVYRRTRDGQIGPITRRSAQRHADFALDASRGRLIAVREDHGWPGREPRNLLVALPVDGDGDGVELVSGSDFYAAPRLSPDGRQLAWISWNHPSMPFTGTELWLAAVDRDGRLDGARRIAGGQEESLCQPAWSPGGVLYVVSDRSGWWNLHRVRGSALEPVCPMQAEFARPSWWFGQATYGFESEDHVVATCIDQGISRLGRIDVTNKRWEPIATDCTDIETLRVVPGGTATMIGGSPARPQQLLCVDTRRGTHEVLATSVDDLPDATWLPAPETLAFPSAEGRTAHAFYYAPAHPHCTAPPGERPPLIVSSHGGPTSMSTSTLRLAIRYWTSRGFAFVDVNYGGSTGYGRAYRELLKGRWGIVDVEDCVAAARHLAGAGRVDPARMAIRGGSASGYTTLRALVAYDVFKAGASHYGVSDLAGLDADTHKLESRYTEWLVAPPPERERLYRERSPLLHADRLSCPVIFFQGLDDKAVPPAQSATMVRALKDRGIPVAYLTFEGEGHGFRKAETIRRCLEAELYFYGRVFGFEPADRIDPVPMDGAAQGGGLQPATTITK